MEAVLEDRDGLIWAASRDGLIRFDPNTETANYYTEKEGLPTAYMVGLLQDQRGNLWLSTKKGLVKFDPQTETFRQYDATDGLQGNEFTERAFGQAADGRMFFGGTNGLTAFYPEQIHDNPYQPPVVLTGFQLFNKPVPPGRGPLLPQALWQTDKLTLQPDMNVITFEFAALSYAAPAKNRYRYRLEGFEAAWNEVGSDRRFATYTNLPPGEYVFRVQGSNNNGVWGDQEARLKVVMLPPWWDTLWSRAAALVGLVGLVYGGYRWRVQSIERRNRLLESQVAVRTRELTERTEDLAQSYALLEQEVIERQRAQEQLLQAKALAEERSQAAEAANRAKSAFLANMSHELRSPLNVILGFAQVMVRSQTLSPEQQENLRIISRSGEHLLSLINQVLDFSKIEAGRITLNENDFDLHHLLTDLEDMFSLKASDKGLQLIFDRPADLPRYIRTDEVKLRQVLINLLGNALKFTEQGEVTLRVRSSAGEQGGRGAWENGLLSPLRPRAPAPLLRFEVADTGPGIAPDEIGHLFEAFAQTETGRQIGEGTGLGLPISRKFAQLMGGNIEVQSQVGQGTTFTFTIQAQQADQIQNPKSKIQNQVVALEPGQPQYRILVVDDQWANRQLLVKLLSPLGFDLREAENGQQALEIWQEFAPQLIWMDMRMPVMDGYQAAQRIKATTQGQATAIIALTASAFEEERAVVLSAGCDDFLRKPFREADIFALMHKHIGVKYVYAVDSQLMAVPESREKIQLEDLASDRAGLPTELLAQLIEGAELGDIELIDQAIAQIRPLHPALAEELARLAHFFEYDKIIKLVRGRAV
jgi:signal transduction histidine kinase/DNA-binding NarL/FixJ family response regulator